ncbi:MAG: alanine--tRNA ligase-related protein, partial [Gemmatimonadales bacterium]
ELKGSPAISGPEAFKLYDTYGFPLDLTQLIAAERGQRVDAEGFERALAEQRARSRAARPGRAPAVYRRAGGTDWVEVKSKQQEWVGYDTTRAETDVIAFRQGDDQLELVLEVNPFYAEAGGQVSDTGVVRGQGWELVVEDVAKANGRNAVVGHFVDAFEPTAVLAEVNETRRRNIERNHTATHLVHAALRKILGDHVRQAGSVVAPDRLRFDFSHHGPIASDLLAAIEAEVNAHLWEDLPVETRQMKYQDALAAGAMALFGEKYGDVVRVVDVPGVSLELCGGTHVPATGQIGLFRFTHETGAAAGVRRIEAITGPAAYRHGRELERRLHDAAALLRTQPEHLARRLESLIEENRKLEKRVEELLKSGGGSREAGERHRIGDIELHVGDSDLDDRDQIGLLMDRFRAQHRRAISVLYSGGARPGIHVAVTDDLVSQGVKAGEIAAVLAAATGGKGGGRPHFASGGVGDPTQLPSTQAQTASIVRKVLGQ